MIKHIEERGLFGLVLTISDKQYTLIHPNVLVSLHSMYCKVCGIQGTFFCENSHKTNSCMSCKSFTLYLN